MALRPITSISATKAETFRAVTPSVPHRPVTPSRVSSQPLAGPSPVAGVTELLPPNSPASGGMRTRVSTITRSSTMSQPTAMRPRSVSTRRRSCSARNSTTVLATERARPKISPAPSDQPISRARPTPIAVATAIWPSAPGTAIVLTESRSFSEKCRPTPNISRMTPISANSVASFPSATKPGVKGPIATPASR